MSRIIGNPADEANLVALALTVGSVVLDVVNGVAATDALVALLVLALGVEQLLAERVVVVVGRGLLDNNLLPVVGDLVDDPLGALAQLQVVEGSDALGDNGNTGGCVSVAAGSWQEARLWRAASMEDC